MTRVRVESFTLSLDGYGAGPNQSLDHPLGVGGTDLHRWAIPTRTFQRAVFGKDGGTTGVDEDFAARGFRNIGAWILGRNMFGPIRGPWPDESWKGWWGRSRTLVAVAHSPDFEQDELDVEFGFVLEDGLECEPPAASGLALRELEAVARMAVCVRVGLPEDAHLVTAKIGRFLAEAGDSLAGPSREVFLQAPDPERMHEAVVEMQFPIQSRTEGNAAELR